MFRKCWHHLTHHRKLPGETEVRWTRFQTAPFPEVLAPSLHQAKSCKKECWRFANNAFFGFLKMNYYIVHVASLSLLEFFGLSFARTGKNGDLIACASRKTSVPIVVKAPSGRQSKWLLGKPFLAKIPILSQACMFRSCWHHLKH